MNNTFSILYRIEWVVTTTDAYRALIHKDFQYPVSDRMGCNLRRAVVRVRPSIFQYPVSDRMGCNSVRT